MEGSADPEIELKAISDRFLKKIPSNKAAEKVIRRQKLVHSPLESCLK